jgi:TetR/AcrR family transcriptional regulator, transcriptional repressor for nem operon
MARYRAGHKEESRSRIVDAAGRGFRRQGFGGAGVDALAKEAGVTHGAFYAHFKSKTEAFRAAVVAGLSDLRTGVTTLRESEGENWLTAFVTYYLGFKRTCELGEACTLPSLTPEVERADAATREAFERELQLLASDVANGLKGKSEARRDGDAYALLALLAGGVALSRAVSDPALSERIADAVRRRALAMKTS